MQPNGVLALARRRQRQRQLLAAAQRQPQHQRARQRQPLGLSVGLWLALRQRLAIAHAQRQRHAVALGLAQRLCVRCGVLLQRGSCAAVPLGHLWPGGAAERHARLQRQLQRAARVGLPRGLH